MHRNQLCKAIKKPHRAISIFASFEKVGLNPCILMIYTIELLIDKKFINYINFKKSEAQKAFPGPELGGWLDDISSLIVYSIVRLVKPEIIIETGVGPGSSSALILNALHHNNKGDLYSIDLPGHDAKVYPQIGRCYNIHVPQGFEVGWLVPPWLKKRWHLHLGDSKQELPELLNSLKDVDIFLHDSLHTDEHILFELGSVYPKLKNGGLVMADDVNDYWSLAFIEFCKRELLPYLVIGHRLGIAKKS